MSRDYIATLESYVIETDTLALPADKAPMSKTKSGIFAAIKRMLKRVGEALQRFWAWLVKKATMLKNYLRSFSKKNPVDTKEQAVKPLIDTFQNRLDGVVGKYLPRMISEGEAAINAGENMAIEIGAGKNMVQWKEDKESFENHATTCKEYREMLDDQADDIIKAAEEKNLRIRCTTKVVKSYTGAITKVTDRGRTFYNNSVAALNKLNSQFERLSNQLASGMVKPTEEIEMSIRYLQTAANFMLFCANASGAVINCITEVLVKYFPHVYKVKPADDNGMT